MNLAGQEPHDQPMGGILSLLLADPVVALAVIPMPRIGAEPPTEFRAFTWGDNPTTKGTMRLTRAGAAKAIANFKARGVAKCFDLWHSTYAPAGAVAPQDRFAVGHFQLELRADGIWFSGIQWVPQYAQEIRDGKWPFISPAVVHTKDGEIFEFKNAGLVTDPGLIGVTPTIMSGTAGEPTKGNSMDKKRKFMDALAAGQMFVKRCQEMDDTELANKVMGGVVPMMDMLSASGTAAGYMGDSMMSGAQLEAGLVLVTALSAEFGESDPAKLGALISAKLDGLAPAKTAPVKGVLLSEADAVLVATQLDALGADRIPATRRAALKAQGPVALATYLSATTQAIAPSTTRTEAPPLVPTSTVVEKTVADANANRAGAPTTLAACTPQQRIQVEGQLSMAKTIMGDRYDEAAEIRDALTTLSDLEPVRGTEIRQLPYGVDPVTGNVTTLSGSI